MTKEEAKQMLDRIYDSIDYEDVSLSVSYSDGYTEFSIFDKSK